MSRLIVHFISGETIEISDYEEMEDLLDNIRCKSQVIILRYPNVVINLNSITYVEIID